jgi:hypothetical protein
MFILAHLLPMNGFNLFFDAKSEPAVLILVAPRALSLICIPMDTTCRRRMPSKRTAKCIMRFLPPRRTAIWKGGVELRGLKPGNYRVADYAEGRDLASVQATSSQAPKLKTEFKQHLLLEVTAQQF